MYGFSLAIYDNRHDACVDDLIASNESNDKAYTVPSPGIVLCISGANNSNFVDSCSSGNWLIVGIGKSYTGVSFAKSISLKLQKRCGENPDLEYLLDGIRKLPGQYCGVLYNKNTGDIVKVTDPSGSRSLFHASIDGAKIFASNLYMFREIYLGNDIKPNIQNQSFLLRYAYSMPEQCAYQGVREMPAGKIEVGSRYSKEVVFCDSFCCDEMLLPNNDYVSTGSNELRNSNEYKLFSCLKAACAQQLGNAQKVGVLLGGFDSALVASILHSLGVQVKTYSFHYSDNAYNQPYVDLLAETLGISHSWVEINSDVIRSGLDAYGKNCSWPTMWLNYVVQTQHVCKQMTKDGMEICFSGDGCDAMFLGYPSTFRRGRVYRRLPCISNELSKRLISLIHFTKLEYIFGHISRVGISLLDAAKEPVERRPLHSFQVFNTSSYRHLTGEEYKSNDMQKKYFSNTYDQISNLTYERKVYLTKSFISPNRAKLISSSDASGIQIHSPYLHNSVKKFASSLPDSALRPDNDEQGYEGKFLLMKMAEKFELLPNEIIYQPKIAAVKSPVDDWLADELHSFSKKKLSALPFDYKYHYTNNLLKNLLIEKIYKKYFSSDDVVCLAPSLLLTYASLFE